MLVLCCKSAVAAGAHLCRAQRGGGHASRSRQQEILPQWGTAGEGGGGGGGKQRGGGRNEGRACYAPDSNIKARLRNKRNEQSNLSTLFFMAPIRWTSLSAQSKFFDLCNC